MANAHLPIAASFTDIFTNGEPPRAWRPTNWSNPSSNVIYPQNWLDKWGKSLTHIAGGGFSGSYPNASGNIPFHIFGAQSRVAYRALLTNGIRNAIAQSIKNKVASITSGSPQNFASYTPSVGITWVPRGGRLSKFRDPDKDFDFAVGHVNLYDLKCSGTAARLANGKIVIISLKVSGRMKDLNDFDYYGAGASFAGIYLPVSTIAAKAQIAHEPAGAKPRRAGRIFFDQIEIDRTFENDQYNDPDDAVLRDISMRVNR
jgi:hypothetical protein